MTLFLGLLFVIGAAYICGEDDGFRPPQKDVLFF